MKGVLSKTTVVLFGLAMSAAVSAGDLSGTWVLTVQSDQGTSNPTLKLDQDGNALTGTYESPQLGTADVSGTVDGDQFNVTANLSMQGQEFALTYSGKQDGDSMSGNLDLGGMGGAEFTGKRQ
ncbi:MAG: hypothetical protein WDZ30_07475 [Cellvibrionaceae bacterium]